MVGSILGLLEDGATHVGVATDHVIESFRNALWRGYKTSAGVPPDLLAQFQILEDALQTLGVVVWPMVEYEADDALGAAALKCAESADVEQVLICTPDKDLAQCVRGTRVVQLIRRTNVVLDEAAVVKKFGVGPESIPDYLALVGDSSDGYPGLQGWGPKSSAAVLAKFKHLEAIPVDWREWHVNANNAAALSRTLTASRDHAFLFRDLATLRTAIPVFDSIDELRWKGPTERFAELAASFDAARTAEKPPGH